VKPQPGIFLEWVPITRTHTRPLTDRLPDYEDGVLTTQQLVSGSNRTNFSTGTIADG
jgi:hypothetical protein